jgi:glycosyltransferase involved in cell wall biosynthesis
MPTPATPPDILCFGSADFEERNWVNAQHLMWRLAERHRVLYINSLGLRAPHTSARDLRKIARRLRALTRGPVAPDLRRGLQVLSPLNLPPTRSGLTAAVGRHLITLQLRAALRRLGFSRPVAWAFLPAAAPALARLDVGPIVYHCVDAYDANPGVDGPLIRALEEDLLALARVVIASSEPLRRRLAPRHPHVVLMTNVADITAFPPPDAPPPEPPDLCSIAHPRVLYLGNLAAYKCDLELLAGAARARSDLQWVFVGGIGRGEAGTPVAALAAHANVHLLGERGAGELAGYVHHCEVGLIPFADNEVTRHSFPMKFFEYLACGRPVVTAALPSLIEHAREPWVFTYRGSSEFLPAIDRACAANAPALAFERRRLAESHSWEQRIAEVEGLLHSLQRSS